MSSSWLVSPKVDDYYFSQHGVQVSKSSDCVGTKRLTENYAKLRIHGNLYQSSTILFYSLSPDAGTLTKVTSSMGRSTVYDMPTEGEFCPAKTLSGKPEFGRIFETSGGNMIQEMR